MAKMSNALPGDRPARPISVCSTFVWVIIPFFDEVVQEVRVLRPPPRAFRVCGVACSSKKR